MAEGAKEQQHLLAVLNYVGCRVGFESLPTQEATATYYLFQIIFLVAAFSK